MKWLTLCLLSVCLITVAQAQEIESYSFEKLNQKLKEDSRNQFLVVNFWATWCKPCIKELPFFEDLSKDLADERIHVMLVSLDMEKERAVNYAQQVELKSEVLYLDEVDFNSWINLISPEWSGAIPATLLLAPSGKQFFQEGAFSQEELNSTIERFILNNQ